MNRFVLVVIFGSFLGTHSYTFAQERAKEMVIRVLEPVIRAGSAVSGAQYLSGYRSSINGQTIEYHSSDPDADSALLVRGQSVAPSISWKSDPMPKPSGGYSQFIWLAGIECHGFAEEKDTHQFNFLINGRHWFTFENAKDATAMNWQIAGKDGAQLSFNGLMTDQAGDLFGYMVLKVPEEDFERGKPLNLEVKGDNSGSADWYMTFQHPFNLTPLVRPEPALVRDGAGTAQVLRLSLDNLTEGRTVEVDTPNHEPLKAELKVGSNILRLPIPAATSETVWQIQFRINNKLAGRSTVRVSPVKKREFYLLCYSHNDIGYTDLQTEVERKQWSNLDEALRLIRGTKEYPPDARYKWNLETIWALESYLKKASKERQAEVLADVREGSIGLSALYANMLTGLATSTEMSHFFDFARKLRADDGLAMTTSVTSDVPGFSWGMVSAMSQNGVKYFATAPNSGDRIGYVLQTWGDKPFYWSSQSGREKVLTWVAGASYSSFHEGTLTKLGDEKIMKLARKLEDASYPYDIVQLPYTLGDNGPPDPTLSDFVRQWNERYLTPHLIIATHEQMFRELEKRYSSTLPVVKGDFTPYWEDGAASTAFETSLNRAAVDRLVEGEALWSMLSPGLYPAEQYEAAWRNIVLYDEHTWGAHNSTEEPDLDFVKQQWEFKRKFALNADQASRFLLAKALAASTQITTSTTAIDVYNINSWPRTDVILLSSGLSSVGDRVVEPGGNPVPSQRLSSGELAVLVSNIPPFSARRLSLEKGEPYSERNAKTGGVTGQGTELENQFIALSVNPQTGAIDKLKWKKNGAQLVRAAETTGLNQYLYVLGTDGQKAQRVSNVRVRLKEQGSLVVSLLVEADAPGANHYSLEIRLVDGIDRIDLLTNIDKRSVREKEGVHIAFPFEVPGGQVRYDVADGIVRPETDQLAGACKNFFSVVSWVDISNDKYGVTWATANAPLIEIGGITAEQPWMKSIPPSSSVYSYVMNNYWHTNYKADQAGQVSFHYAILPHGEFRAADAVKFGMEQRQALIVAAADPSKQPQPALLSLSSAEVLVSSIKPLSNGNGWLVRLYNPTETTKESNLRWNGGQPVAVHSSDAAGTIGSEMHKIEVAPFGSLYLRVDKTSTRKDRILRQ